MNRYPNLMAGAVGAAMVVLPFAIGSAALAQERSTRQIVVEPQAETKADETKTEAATGDEAQKETTNEQKAATAADEKAEATSEDKASGITVVKPATKTEETEKAEVKEETPEAKEETAEAKEKVVVEDKAVEPAKLSQHDIALALQTELKRVGCYFGALDGIWGPRSKSALDAFSHYGKVKDDDFTPSEAWIAHVKAKTKKVCRDSYGGYARPYRGPGYRPGYYRRGYGAPPPPRGYRGGYGRGGYYGRY